MTPPDDRPGDPGPTTRRSWTPDQLTAIADAVELEIAACRSDGSTRDFLPIWAVVADGGIYVRTWHRRDTGWFGAVLRSERAQIRVPSLALEVAVTDVGTGTTTLREAVDAAYREKYGTRGGAERMVDDEAASTTLRLDPAV